MLRKNRRQNPRRRAVKKSTKEYYFEVSLFLDDLLLLDLREENEKVIETAKDAIAEGLDLTEVPNSIKVTDVEFLEDNYFQIMILGPTDLINKFQKFYENE